MSAADTFRTLYRSFWQLCAGWNRRPFADPQLRHVLRRGVAVSIAPLGNLDAIAMLVDKERFIGLNVSLCPGLITDGRAGFRELTLDDISCLGPHARFVLLHEVGHLLLHSNHPAFWRTEALHRGSPYMRWIEEKDIVVRAKRDPDELVPATIREVEADFYALIALIPDSLLFNLDVTNSLSVDAIAGMMGMTADLTNAEIADMRSLAAYRLNLYRKFSHLFLEVSSEPFVNAEGEPFRRVRTIDNVQPDILRRRNAPEVSEKLVDAAMAHPRVDSDRVVYDALQRGDYSIFEHLEALSPWTNAS